jgi:hypothetical protein
MKNVILMDNGLNWKNRLIYWDKDIMYKIVFSVKSQYKGVDIWTLSLKEY